MPDPGGSTKRNPGSHFGTDLLIVTTVGVTLAAHYRGQLRYLSASGIRVQIASNPDADLLSAAEAEGVPCHGVRMSRRISPVRDVASVFHMILLLRRLRPAVVCYGTPKAALVTSFAAAIMRVPSRIYTVHGLRLETATGFLYWLLWLGERTISLFSTEIVCVSSGVRSLGVRKKLFDRRAIVLGSGSINGVDLSRYQHVRHLRETRVGSKPPVIGFIGRMTPDKGVTELVWAFRSILRTAPDTKLLLIGGWDADEPPLTNETLEFVSRSPSVQAIGWTADVRPYLAQMDVLVLPSHREGLPVALLEAAASSIPIVASAATGVSDVIEHGTSGLVVAIGDVSGIADATITLIRNSDLSRQLSRTALSNVRRRFSQERVWDQWREFFLLRIPRSESGR